jgi:hypothetical protein
MPKTVATTSLTGWNAHKYGGGFNDADKYFFERPERRQNGGFFQQRALDRLMPMGRL